MMSLKNRRVLSTGLALLAILAATAWYLGLTAGSPVKKIAVKLQPAGAWPAPGTVAVFRGAEELHAAYPGAEVQLERPVDFDRECLVRVAWESAGILSDEPAGGSPSDQVLFGKLRYSARMGGRKILFFVDEPGRYGTVRRVFQTSYNDEWFTIPKQARVAMENPWAVTVRDALVVLMSAGVLGIARFAWQTRLNARSSGSATPSEDS